MVRVSAGCLMALTLAGCGLFKAKPVEYVPYEVKVPVPVPCAAEIPPEPAWATADMPRVDPVTGAGIDVATDKLLAERAQRMGYEAKLKAVTEGCR